MSFITFIEEEATVVEAAVVDGLKAGLNYIDNVLVTQLEPALIAALKQALSVAEQAAVAAFLSQFKKDETNGTSTGS